MPLRVSPLLATVTGSRRRTGAPRSQRGTRLKATTDRAFLVSTGIPPPARATEKACPSLPGERAGKFPNQSTAAQFGLSSRPRRVSIVRQRQSTHVREPLGAGPVAGTVLGECYDRTYPGIPAQPPQRGPRHRAVPRGRPRSQIGRASCREREESRV